MRRRFASQVEGALGSDEPLDPRVAMVLEVLTGAETGAVAQRWAVDVNLLTRWVHVFVQAGDAVVTNRPQAAAAMERDRFLNAFAHELRTPLAAAQTWTEMLRGDDVDPELNARGLTALDKALVRLADRVREVELLAAASLGRIEPTPQRVSVAELVASLPVDVPATSAPGDTYVVVDPELFGHVLIAMWRAASLPPTPRSVRLECSVAGPWFEIRVIREADPIEPRLLYALFEPFGADNVNADGSGLTTGLYLARALVTAHGGSIGLEQDDEHLSVWVRVLHQPHATPTLPVPPGPADLHADRRGLEPSQAPSPAPNLSVVTPHRPRTTTPPTSVRP